jgi:hypothetical protein
MNRVAKKELPTFKTVQKHFTSTSANRYSKVSLTAHRNRVSALHGTRQSRYRIPSRSELCPRWSHAPVIRSLNSGKTSPLRLGQAWVAPRFVVRSLGLATSTAICTTGGHRLIQQWCNSVEGACSDGSKRLEGSNVAPHLVGIQSRYNRVAPGTETLSTSR